MKCYDRPNKIVHNRKLARQALKNKQGNNRIRVEWSRERYVRLVSALPEGAPKSVKTTIQIAFGALGQKRQRALDWVNRYSTSRY